MSRITDEDLKRFHQNAPGALARRGRSYVLNESWGGVQTVVFGTLPIVGLLYWEWSGIEMLVFLIVSLWVGIGCDLTKFVKLQKRAEAFANARCVDWHVWVVADAIRSGKEEAPSSHMRAKWEPWNGVYVDLVFGTISSLLILALMFAQPEVNFQTFFGRGLVVAVLVMAISRAVQTTWEIYQHRQTDAERGEVAVWASDRPVKAAVGLRGVALFFLMFLVVFLTEESEGDATNLWVIAMCVINGLVVLYGFVGALGWLWIRGETRWLREYLANRRGDGESSFADFS